MSGIRINEIPRESTFDGAQDLVHVYKLVGGQYKSFSAPLNAVAFQGARGNDGVDGLNGQDGIGGDSVAQLVCYRRFPSLATTSEINAATPGLGSNDDGKFDFDQREFTPPTGWSAGVPPIESGQETYKLYVSNGVAKITGKSGVDDNIEWSNPEATGIQGLAGSDGVSTYQAVVFTRSDTQPAAPTGGSFNFGTDTLLSPISGVDSVRNPDGTNTHNWYVDTGGDLGPPGDAQLYMCNHQFSAPGDTGTDTATEWSVPTRFASDGANGISTYFGSIYKRTNSDISGIRPGAGDAGLGGYYDFRANQFVLPADSLFAANPSNSFNGWSEEVPAEEVAGQRTALWQSTVLASSSGSFLGSGDVRDYSLIWGEPVKVQQPAVDGNQGNAVTQVRAYLRSVGATPPVIGDLTNAIFNFENKILDVSNTSWSNAPFKSPIQPNEANYGNDFLYVSVGVASTAYDAVAGSYPNDTNINWADPILSPEDGEAAISTYLGQVYTRYAGSTNIQTTSRAPTGGSFNFSNSVLTVPTDPDDELTWTANIPTGFGQIYVSQRNFAVLGNSGTDNWNSGNPWSAPAILAYDGLAGSNGITNSRITLYYGSDNEVSAGSLNFPDDVTVSVNLDTSSSGFGKPTKSTTNGVDANITAYQVLSSNSVGTTQGTGWYTQLPSNDWIYVIEAVAADSDASDSNYIDTILGTEWSDAVAYRKPGSNGLAGLGTAIISLYKRTGTTGVPNPAEPSGPVKYYLGSGDGQLRGDIISIDSTNFNGWTKDPPSYTNSNDHYLWQINATASSRLCADKIFANEWSTPRIFSQNPFDLTETTVSHIIQAYIRSSVLPTTDPGSCTVALSGENAGQITAALSNGWSREIPDGDQQVYIAHATAAGSVTTITDTDTVSANEWSTPAKWGIVGEQGEQGIAGNVAKIITLYKRTTRNPSPVVVVPALDGNYDFNADSFTFVDPNNETWTLEIPAKQVNDKILWQTFATALCSQDSSVYNLQGGIDGDWKTPKAVIEDGVTITPVFSSNFDGVSASLDSVYVDGNGAQQDHTHINFSDEYESIDSSQILTKTNGDTIAANTLTFTKIKGEQGPSGNDGTDGSSTVTIFSDVENPTIGTDNLSYIRTSGSIERNFVTYVNFGPNETYQSTNDLDLTDSNNQTFINGLNFGNIKGDQGVGVASITRASDGVVTVNYDDSTSDTFTITDGADLTVTDVQRTGETVTMTFSDSTTKTFDVADGNGIGSVTTSKVGTTTTVTIKDDNDVTLRQFDISDGLPGAKGRVLVVYAEDADGTNPGTTIGSREFVKYHEYEGDVAPNISDFAADTGTLSGGFVQFIGPQGITNSIFPIYADDASGTNATVDASTNKPFVTFVESSTPITNSNIPSGQTYVKYLGSDGTSVTIQGSKDDQSELDALASSATTGDSYIGTGNGDLDEGNLYVFDGSTFNDVGTIQGPTGNTGKNATPVYATSSGGASASLTPAAGKTFIAFVNFTNANPQDSDIPGGLTYTNFKGTGITSVEKTGTTVKVNFSDGTNDTFTVNDGADLTVTDVQRSASGTVTMTFSDSTTKTFDVADGVGIGSVTSTKNGTTTTVVIKDDNGTTLKQFQLEDGLPGAAANILVVFADNALGLGASTSPGSGASKKRFVKYHEYTGNTPSAATAAQGGGFVEYVGADGSAGTPITPIYATSSSGANATLNESSITATHVNFVEGSVAQSGGTFVNTSTGIAITISDLTFVKIKGEAGDKGDKGDKGDIGPVGSVPIFASDEDGNDASLTQTSSTPYVFFYTGGSVDPLAPQGTLKGLGSNGAWTKIAGDSLYIHVKYADRVLTSDDSVSDMTDDPTGKKYVGISYNNTSSNESTSGPGDFSWSLIQGNAGRPDGCQAVWGYNNSDGESSITYLEDENVLQLAPSNGDTSIGMVYPAVDVTDGRTVQFTVSYKTPDAADTDGVYLRIYEATTDLAEGKDRVGFLSVGTGSTTEIDNSPLIQTKNRQHFWDNGSASSSQGGPGITVTPSSADLENGPVSNEYKTVTITFAPDASSKYISLTILNWTGMGTKRLWVKPVRTTIVGDKGDKGTNSITTRLAEIFYKQNITLRPPAVTRQLLVLNTDSIITANPLQSNSNGANWRTIATDADGNSTTSVGATNIKMWHRTFPAAGIGTPAASITNSGWSYDDTTGIIKLTATQSGGTGGFGSYFRVANLKENTKYNVSGEFRIVEDDPGGTVMMVDMSDGSESDTTADGTDVFRVQTTSTSFTSFNVRGTMTSAKLDTISNLNGDTPYHYFIDFNILTQGSGAKNGTITGEFRNILIEEITNESAVSNTTYDISTGNLANVPSGWATIPPNAESGSKIYRSTAIVSYDADLETDTDAVVLIPDTDWGIPRAWSDGGNRTAPAVARLAFYQYLDSDYVSINNDNAPQSNYYSFRKASASSTTDVNNGWGSSITTAIDPITDIKQVLFTIAGKDDVQYNDFWKGLNTASEFIWKYGSSWILFQRTAAVDVAGSYTGVKVNVLDHSEDISQIRDLPAFFSTSNASIADVVFGYNPVFNKTTLSIYQRNNSITPPSRPVGSVTYSFADESITSGSIGSWSVTTPDAGDGQGKYLWVSNATAAAELDVTTGQYFDDITRTEWSFPRIMAQDGIAGEQGATYFTKFLYTRTTVSNPTLVSQWANSTTNNSYKPGQVNIISDVTLGNIGDVLNDTISALTTTAGVVWSEDIPPESNGQFLWVIVAPVSNTPIGVVASNQWAEPALLSKDGVGLNSATVRLYKRTDGSTPSTGSSNNRLGFSYINSSTPTFTYNFSTGNLNLNGVTINGWSTTIPETGGNTLWVSRAIASGSGTTDEIGWGQWQVPEKLVTDGSGLIFIGSFNNRNSYLAHINNNNNGYNGVPPVNSYHIETGTDGRNVSYLYTGGPNTTDKNSGNNFDQLTIDGVQGQPGTSITFKGTAESLNGIVGASEGDVYRITGGTGPSQVYVRKSNAWAILTTDGDDGQRGVTGTDGNSVYICYSPLSIETSGGNGPTKPANNSNGNVGTTWYTSSIPPAGKTYHWMSQKIARTPTDAAIAWSEPIQISGSAGEPGFRTIALKIYKRSETQPNLPPSGSTSGYGAFDFENNKLLIPEGWSSTIANAGSDPDGTNPADPRDGKGYEWILGNGGSQSDSSTWVVGGKQNLSNLSNESRNALWSSEAIASIQANTVGQIDTDIYWTSPLQEQIDGIDLVDGSMDVDVVFGAVKNGGGVEKIVANDKQDPPQLLTQAAYDALADINLETHTAAERAAYGWSSTGIQIDVVQADTLYIIF